jgi:hypothetical protein
LAPRMIHYTYHELVYHCRESRACECGGLGETLGGGIKRSLPSFYFSRSPFAASFSGLEISSEPHSAQMIHQLQLFKGKMDNLYPYEKSLSPWNSKKPIWLGELWEEILIGYTRARLTYDSDILLALSGVSRLMQAYNPGRFYAGLWAVDMLYQPAWRSERVNEDFPPRRPTCYTAPSFSWASRVGPVSFPYGSVITPTCSISDVHCDLVDTNPFGQVSGGYISLHGRLLAGTIQKVDERPIYAWSFVAEGSEGVDSQHTLSDDSSTSYRSSECAENCWVVEKLNRVALDVDGWLEDSLHDSFYCFELFQSYESNRHLGKSYCVHSTALVLRRSSSEHNVFHRVGLVQAASPRQFETVNIEEIIVM